MEYKSNASRSKASSKKANSLKGLQRKSLQPWPTMFDLSYSCSMPVTPEPVEKRRLCLLKAILVIHGCILTKKRWHSWHWTWWCQYVDEGLNAWTAIFRAQLPRFWNHNSPPHDYPDWGRSAWETSPEQGGLLQVDVGGCQLDQTLRPCLQGEKHHHGLNLVPLVVAQCEKVRD